MRKKTAKQKAKKKLFDLVSFIMAWESGSCTEEEQIEGFQHLVDSGDAWKLQGMYGRTAAAMIEAGVVKDTHGVLQHGN